MAEITNTPEPQLQNKTPEPKGVLQKNLKAAIWVGAVVLLILASLFTGKSKTPKIAAKGTPPQPMLQDTTQQNAADLHNQVQAERAKEQQDAAVQASLGATGTGTDTAASPINPQYGPAQTADYAPGGRYYGCTPGQYCAAQTQQMQQSQAMPQLTPIQQQQMQIEAQDRERQHSSLFASNIAFAYTRPQQQQQSVPTIRQPASAFQDNQDATNLVSPRAAGDAAEQGQGTGYKRPVEANIDSATGQPYLIYEGAFLDTVLMNRLDGDSAGAVKVMVSNPLYSHDNQHVLIPEGTVVLGESRKIGASGFGQQRRMAVVFHRMIMPDGYSVDLDQFHGLDQIGEEGLKDKVNNHYLEIFGTSVALGVIAGAAEITEGGGTISTSGTQAFTTGAATGVSQQATTVLDKFINIPPTITIREGHRVKVYFTQDMLLPAYTNHTISQTF